MNRESLTEAEKIDFVGVAVNKMAEYTFPFVGSVLKTDSCLHVGSALRLQLAGRRLLVSARHVFQEAGVSIAVSAKRGCAPIQLSANPCFEDALMDIRADELSDAYPPLDGGFWPAGEVDATDEMLDSDVLFFQGFPAVRSKSSSLLGGTTSATLPYGAMLRSDGLPPDLKAFQFAMDFDPSNFQTVDASPAEWLHPEGLSGSPVWRIGAGGGTASEWTPSRCRLVGIVTQWKPDEKLIVATKISACWAALSSPPR